MNHIKQLLLARVHNPYELSLFDWQQSLFWTFMGIVSVGACLSSSNKRIQTEYKRLEMQQKKNELLKELIRVQDQLSLQQQQLAAAEALLSGNSSSSGNSKQSWRDLQRQLLGTLGS